MPDHPTAIALKTHVADPVPFVFIFGRAAQITAPSVTMKKTR